MLAFVFKIAVVGVVVVVELAIIHVEYMLTLYFRRNHRTCKAMLVFFTWHYYCGRQVFTNSSKVCSQVVAIVVTS